MEWKCKKRLVKQSDWEISGESSRFLWQRSIDEHSRPHGLLVVIFTYGAKSFFEDFEEVMEEPKQ